jgi:hypothetical protein
VLEALKSYPYSLLYADKNMMKNKDIVLYFFKSLKKNEYLATSYHSILMKIHPSLLDDEKIMLEAVKKNGMYLQYASKMLKGNQRIAMQAVSTNGMALKYVDKELLRNKEIIAMALKNNPKIMYYIYYVKNRIKRKFKPLAWESYDINETLNLLYGKNRIYEKSKEIHIKLPTNTLEYFDYKYIKIATTKKVKSISILQKKEGDRALIALYQPYGRTSNIRLPLKILNAMLTMGIEGMKIIVVTETEDKHLFLNEYRIKYRNFCTSFDYGKDDYLDELKEDLTKKILKTKILRTKYRIDKNGNGALKFMIYNPMLSYEEANKLNIKINFVSYVEGYIQDEKLFDLYMSEYIKKDPVIEMKFQNMKKGDNIKLSYRTINGEVASKEAIVREVK